jgi:hypothetical protein
MGRGSGREKGTGGVSESKSERKKPLGKPGYGRKNEIFFKEIKWEGVKWIHLAQDSNKWPVLFNTVS